MKFDDIAYSAELSDCGEYRYSLSRIWSDRRKPLAFVMLNPSTADALEDDPTIRRCMSFALDAGFGGIVVGNLYALRATDPTALWDHADPIGPGNDRWLKKIARQADVTVCAWGANGPDPRVHHVMGIINPLTTLVCLGRTKDLKPKHPLYLRKNTPFEAYP